MRSNISTGAVELMSILQIRNSAKRRAAYNSYLRSKNFEALNDHAIFEKFEDIVFEAMMATDVTLELDTILCQHLLVVLRDGLKKVKGGQALNRSDKARKRTLVSMARAKKVALQESGLPATDAHLQAAEEIAEIATNLGIKISAGYLAREMDRIRQ